MEIVGGARLPRGHERRDGPVASNTLGVLKRSQRVAVTLLGTGYSPHEGVPGRRCALDAGVSGVSGVSGRAPSVLIRRQSGVTGKTR